MAIRIPRGKSDSAVKQIVRQLQRYTVEHSEAEIDVYRKNPYSIWIRVVDPSYRTLGRAERSRVFWPLLHQLPEETLSEVSMVLLISPEEMATSVVSHEFDDPLPSRP